MKPVFSLPQNGSLCIGCGLCAVICPNSAIEMIWNADSRWVPRIDLNSCNDCGLCVRSCPFAPNNLEEWYEKFSGIREVTGLHGAAGTFLAWNNDHKRRLNSPSGGVLTEVLKTLLVSGEVSAVIAAKGLMALTGKPHSRMQLLRTAEEIEASRGSFYEPQCYTEAIREAVRSNERCALVGTPCVLRALELAGPDLNVHIKYRVGLVCSHSTTGEFMDCLARMEGMAAHSHYRGNLRSKDHTMRSANDYFNTFEQENGQRSHRNRFSTDYTRMWRNYFFSQECCLYCPDFFATTADITAKDAWGKFSDDPLGKTMLIVRNRSLLKTLDGLQEANQIHMRSVTTDEVMQSQRQTPLFKQVHAATRWRIRNGRPPENNDTREVKIELLRLDRFRRLSRSAYKWFGHYAVHLLTCLARTTPPLPATEQKKTSSRIHVVLAGGYGYGNVGDDAQLSRCLVHWRECLPNARITVLSPNPAATAEKHAVFSVDASRNVWFGADVTTHYLRSDSVFRFWFFWVAFEAWLRTELLLLRQAIARRYPHIDSLMKRFFLCSKRRSRANVIESILLEANVLHLVGGGYLTSMTKSRLWDHMLLVRLAARLGTRVVLSGQTTGPFNDCISRRLARWGLQKADMIFLRDRDKSIKQLSAIGITGKHVCESFDDALFCASAAEADVDGVLKANDMPRLRDYVVVNFHHWGMDEDTTRAVTTRMAEICDHVAGKLGEKLVMVPMHRSDENAIAALIQQMKEPGWLLKYAYDFRLAKGVIARAKYCLSFKHHPIVFSLGFRIPVIAIALDDYYRHKNEGLLRLFGQEEWLMSKNTFWDDDSYKQMIERFTDNLERARETISTKLSGLAPRDGEMVTRTCLELLLSGSVTFNATDKERILGRALKMDDGWREILAHIVSGRLKISATLREKVVTNGLADADGWQVCLALLEKGQLALSAQLQDRNIVSAVRELIAKRWKNLFAQDGFTDVALFCAGKHTEWLLNYVKSIDAPLPSVIIDEIRTDSIDGIAIVSPEQFLKEFSSTECIVISSDANETTAFQRGKELFGDKLPIITLYQMKWGTLFARLNPKVACLTIQAKKAGYIERLRG